MVDSAAVAVISFQFLHNVSEGQTSKMERLELEEKRNGSASLTRSVGKPFPDRMEREWMKMERIGLCAVVDCFNLNDASQLCRIGWNGMFENGKDWIVCCC